MCSVIALLVPFPLGWLVHWNFLHALECAVPPWRSCTTWPTAWDILHAMTSGKSSGNANQGWTPKPFPPTCCPQDVKLIHSHRCLRTGQATIPEVWWALRILCLLRCFYSIFSHLHQQKDTLLHSCFLCKCCLCFGTVESLSAAARTSRKWQRLFKKKHLLATSLDTTRYVNISFSLNYYAYRHLFMPCN